MKNNKLVSFASIPLWLIAFLTGCLFTSAQWSNRYNGQGDYSDRFTSVQTDAAGNVYLAGSTINSGQNQNILILKLDSNGNELWRTVFDGPSSGADAALSMTLDSSGNIYVTGYAKFSASGTDVVTMKLTNAGQITWTANYGFTTDQYEQGNSVVVDSAGNVFVAGQSDPDSTTTTSDDYVVLKYNAQGVQQWVQRTNGTGNGIDRPSKVALDPAGNPVVTGRSDNLVNYDYLTVKYNTTNGTPMWSMRYDRTHNDWATDIVIHPTSGNIYITGRSKNTTFDYVTICYSGTGVQQWATVYDFGIGDDRATNIALDNSGNLYVTGQSDVGTATVNFDITTVKYNAAGAQQWVKTFGGAAQNDDIPSAIAVDAAGSVWVTGTVDTDATTAIVNDFLTIKYNTSGVQQWQQTYNAQTASNDFAKSIAVDASGAVIVAGYAEIIPQKNAVALKYSSAGLVQWTKTVDAEGDNSDKPNSLALDASGNVLVAGSVVEYGTDKNFALQKINATGNTAWVRTINGTSVGSADAALGVVTDAAGNIYLAGYTHNKGTSSDYTVAKYDTAGTLIWSANYDFITETDRALAIALDATNNVYVTGRSDSDASNTITNDDIATLKYSTTGTVLWTKRYNGTGNGTDTGRVIKVSASGNVYVAGRTWNGTNFDVIVIKYNSAGAQQWAYIYNSTGNEEAFFMEIDASENVYVLGNADNAAANTDLLTLKINSAGVQQWVKKYDSSFADISDAIKIDSLGNCIIGGTVDTDSQSTTLNNDMIVIKYDSAGNQSWLYTYNGTSNADDFINDLAIDSSNSIYVTGATNGPTNYDYATFKLTAAGTASNPVFYNGTANGSDIAQDILVKNTSVYVTGSSFGTNAQSDIFTIKYDVATLGNSSFENNNNSFFVSPNPANRELNVHFTYTLGGSQTYTASLIDMAGRNVFEQSGIQSAGATMTLPTLSPGTYVLTLKSDSHGTAFGTVKVAIY
ncbi:MAG: hypothetical protein CFE24_11605 [Flavobacterium sp. BFFFF2]|nr:MAG: hypothetical protein CFE24_11605 [Flavobacterium sp. BFFFF2]